MRSPGRTRALPGTLRGASSSVTAGWWIPLAALLVVGCAVGDDGVVPRGGDAGDPPQEPDASAPTGCTPPCTGSDLCRDGACVPPEMDADSDGVSAAIDCDDGDATVGAVAERPCSSACGDGVERCTDGVWMDCTAPQVCDCVAGTSPRELECERCGVQRQTCVDGTWTDDGVCTDQGACSPGAVETGGGCARCGTLERSCATDCTWRDFTCVDQGVCEVDEEDVEVRDCPGGCGNTQSRTRTCDAACGWGPWSDWTTCEPCGSVCGDGVCDADESCSTCEDCQHGHQGTGENDDPCTGVPENTWRCVYSSRLGGNVSQFCRDGVWTNFNLAPMDCAACVCSFSTACCQPGSSSSGC